MFKFKSYFFVLFVLLYILVINFLHINAYSQTVLKGGIRALVERGNILEVKLSTPVNFYFSQTGDNIAAFTAADIDLGDGAYIPKGTRLNGIITKVKEPQHFGIGGAFEIDFNELVTQADEKIPIYASVSSDVKEKSEKIAGILTYDSALIAYGTFHGAVAALQYGGIGLLIASHGISALAGAGVGASLGLIGAVARKGNVPSVSAVSSVPLLLKSDFYVLGDLERLKEVKNTAKEEDFKGFRFYPKIKKEDIEITLKTVREEHDRKFGNYIVIEFNLKNNSPLDVNISDFVLIEEKKDEKIHPDLFLSGNEIFKVVKPQDELNSTLSFLTLSEKDSYSLALVDSLDSEEIVRVPLEKQ